MDDPGAFGRGEFVFMDLGESPLLFYLDCLALWGLFVFLAYYGLRSLRAFHGTEEGRTKAV